MPKRDDEYMQGQRDAIARAALSVLIEKGYYETTLRDVCRAAGISNGALYSYFPTREAVIVAACLIDHAAQLADDAPESWAEYAQHPLADEMKPGTYRSRRLRLSLQFAAEISQMDNNPEGLALVHQVHRQLIVRSLVQFKDRNVISMPLGLEITAELHAQLFWGCEYMLASNRQSDPGLLDAALRKGLAITAGLNPEESR